MNDEKLLKQIKINEENNTASINRGSVKTVYKPIFLEKLESIFLNEYMW